MDRRPLHTSPDGRQWFMDFEQDGSKTMVAIREVVPAALHQKLKDDLHAVRSEWRAGQLQGNTQHHWQHVTTLTPDMVTLWTTVLGDPSTPEGEKAWKKRLNDAEYNRLRASGGMI